MDRVRIKRELRKINWPVIVPGSDSVIDFAQHIAAIAREESLEQAANICDQYGVDIDNEWNRGLGVAKNLKETADDLAEQIRTLKDTK